MLLANGNSRVIFILLLNKMFSTLSNIHIQIYCEGTKDSSFDLLEQISYRK